MPTLPSNPFANSAAQVEKVVQSFEEAWQRGDEVTIDDFRHITGVDSRLLLVELVHTELELRLQAGETVRVEDYLRRYPELAADTNALLQLVAAEITLRRQRDPNLSIDEYLQRFPEHRDFFSTVPKPVDPLATAAYTPPEGAAPEPKSLLAATSNLPPVPGHELLGVLGRGGMGVVYKARHERLKRLVAVKMILGGAHAGSEEHERFCREAEAVAKLQHPNIVQIYEVGDAEGRPFFSLEYVAGGSLQKQIGGTPQPGRRTAEQLELLARAMQAAHDRGIIHRDLKPANVLLAEDGTPKITDFGLAKELESDSGQTRSGAVMGTPSYMAPEQASGKVVGPPADIYALGAILYEMLTGRPPFKGADLLDTLDQVKNSEPVPPSRLQPKTPRDLETICLKCLEKDSARRYARAADLADDLRRYLDGEPIHARPAGLLERGVKFTRRKPYVVAAWGAIAATVLCIIAGSTYVLYRRNLDLTAELRQRDEMDRKRSDAGVLLRDADRAAQERNWPRVEAIAREALALVGDEPGLADLRDRARTAQDDAARMQQFAQHCHTALYHEMLGIDGSERARHFQATRAAASAATGLLRDNAGQPIAALTRLPANVQAQLNEDHCEMLLAWSRAVALQPAEDAAHRKAHAAEALRLLDGVPPLGVATRVYHLRRAELLTEVGDAAAADVEKKRAAAVEPNTAVDCFVLGLEANSRGDTDTALAQFKKALEREPDHFWASYYLAGSHMKARQHVRALEPLKTCIDQKPDFAWPYILRGTARGLLGDFEEALADFQRAEQAHPDDLARYGILVNRAVVRVSKARAEEIQRRPAAARASLDAAIFDFQTAIALRPQQGEAYANLADVYVRLGQPADALPLLDKAIGIQPSAALHRTRANLLVSQGKHDQALPDLEEAIRREPLRASPELAGDHTERGRILYRQRKFADALRAFDAALAVYPKLHAGHQLRGEALFELNRLQEAEAAFDDFFDARQRTSTAYRARGLIRSRLNKFAGAIEDYTQALELERAAGQKPEPLTLSYRGWAYLINDAPKLAVRDFDEALKQDKCDRVDCLNGRGYARVLLGQWQQGVADAEAALKEKPTQPRALYNLARIYARAAASVPLDPVKRDALAEEQRRQFEEKSLKLLRAACQLSPADGRAAFWKEYVQTDPALKGVRRHAGYMQLAAEYGRVGQ